MFAISQDGTICVTRGDVCEFAISAKYLDDLPYTFLAGDVLRFTVLKKNKCDEVIIQKDFAVDTVSQSVVVSLTKEDTKIGEIINRPVDYWYEVELNPDTDPRTIIGYDDDGGKIFRLYPEGSVKT